MLPVLKSAEVVVGAGVVRRRVVVYVDSYLERAAVFGVRFVMGRRLLLVGRQCLAGTVAAPTEDLTVGVEHQVVVVAARDRRDLPQLFCPPHKLQLLAPLLLVFGRVFSVSQGFVSITSARLESAVSEQHEGMCLAAAGTDYGFIAQHFCGPALSYR
jgi:hypothetical protein